MGNAPSSTGLAAAADNMAALSAGDDVDARRDDLLQRRTGASLAGSDSVSPRTGRMSFAKGIGGLLRRRGDLASSGRSTSFSGSVDSNSTSGGSGSNSAISVSSTSTVALSSAASATNSNSHGSKSHSKAEMDEAVAAAMFVPPTPPTSSVLGGIGDGDLSPLPPRIPPSRTSNVKLQLGRRVVVDDDDDGNDDGDDDDDDSAGTDMRRRSRLDLDDDEDDDDEEEEDDRSGVETVPLKHGGASEDNNGPREQIRRRKLQVYFTCPPAIFGMAEERRLLEENVFPQLQRYCDNRGILFTPILLDPSPNDPLSRSGNMLDICLRQISTSDLFVCLYGAHYGWHDSGGDTIFQANINTAAPRFPWVSEFKAASFTEIEILHGHLREAERPAFLFFRSAEYDKERATDTIETLATGFIPENEEAAQARFDLIFRLSSSKKALCFDNYLTPTQGTQLIARALMAYVDRHYLRNKPNTIDIEYSLQEAYLRSQLKIKIPGSHYYDLLDQQLCCVHNDVDALALAPSTQPIRKFSSNIRLQPQSMVVTGSTNSGRSAILAQWVARHTEVCKEHFIFSHFVGASNSGRSLTNMLRRLADELKRHFGLTGDVPTEFGPFVRRVYTWLDQAAKTASIILVLDGIDAFEYDPSESEDKDNWLGKLLPPASVAVLLSCSPGRTINALTSGTRHPFRALDVSALIPAEKMEIMAEAAISHGQTWSDDDKERILGSPQTANPLFLSILLDELVDMRLGQNTSKEAQLELLRAADCEELCLSVLTFVEKSFGNANLVRDVFSCLLVVHSGLTPTELGEILHLNPNELAHILTTLDRLLVKESGVLQLAHDVLERAASARYFGEDTPAQDRVRQPLPSKSPFASPVSRSQAARRVAVYFEKRRQDYLSSVQLAVSSRIADELPWLLAICDDKDSLLATLTTLPVFNALCMSSRRIDFNRYWAIAAPTPENAVNSFTMGLDDYEALQDRVRQRQLRQPKSPRTPMTPGHETNAEFRSQSWSINVAKYARNIGDFLRQQRLFGSAVPFQERALSLIQQVYGSGSYEAAAALNDLARTHLRLDKLDVALGLWKQVLSIHEAQRTPEDQTLASTLNNIALVYEKLGNWAEAEAHFLRALEIYIKQSGGEDNLDVAITCSNIGQLFLEHNQYEKAADMYAKCIQIKRKLLGAHHQDIAMNLNNLGMVYAKMKKVDLAVKVYQEAVVIREESHGKEHEDVALFLLNLGVLCVKNQSLKEAKVCLYRAYEIRRKAFGETDKRTQAVYSWIKYMGAADDFSVFQSRRASMQLTSSSPAGSRKNSGQAEGERSSPYRMRLPPGSGPSSLSTTPEDVRFGPMSL